MYAVEDDPYCYPGTSVLRNRFDIQDLDQLQLLESELTAARADEPLPPGNLDEAHFRAIHHHLFQDLYDWAGETRIVRLSKGTSHFCFPEYIDVELGKRFAKLESDNWLKGLPQADFLPRTASLLADLNVIHTFREGNGRAQLSYIFLVAEEAGHPLDSDRLDPAAMLDPMIASFRGDEAPLCKLLAALV